MTWHEIIKGAGTFLVAFLLGSIPTGYLMVKATKGIDIRKTGSGNIGATNVGRVLGKWGFALVLLLDALKGFLPTGAAVLLFGIYPGIAAFCGAFLGHIFTPWLGFRGGKGVATGLGAFLALDPIAMAVGVGAWLIVFLIGRYVSLASVIAALSVFLFVTFVQGSLPLSILSGAAAITVWFTHRSNMKRLLEGTENRVSFKRKRKGE
ncbi:MAG: glycerol-3-phosphate 1-O-acyltransferase PlsY [candidate division WOR-3 bacterium]